MTNAKQELLYALKNAEGKLLAARITRGDGGEYDPIKKIILSVGYDEEALANFLNDLNFDYDPGYGLQEMYGVVWLDDGTWLERGEYDGSEWWEHKKCPEIPEELSI